MAALKLVSEQPDKLVLGKGGGGAAGALIGILVFGAVTVIALGSLLGEGGEVNLALIFIFVIIGFSLLSSFAKSLASTRVVLDAGQRTASRVQTLLFFPIRRQEMAFNLIRDVQVTRLPGSGAFSLDILPIWLVQLQATDGSTLVVNDRGTRGEMDALAQKVGTLLSRPVRGENESKPLPQQPSGPDTVTYTPATVVTSLFQNLAEFAQSATVATYTPPVAAPGPSPRLRQDDMERAPRGQRPRRQVSKPAPPNTFIPTTARINPDAPFWEASADVAGDSTVMIPDTAVASASSAVSQSSVPGYAPMSLIPSAAGSSLPIVTYSAPAVLVMPELPGMMTFAPALEMPSFSPIGISAAPQTMPVTQVPEVKVVEAQVTGAAPADTGSEAWTLYRAARKQHALRNFRDAESTYLRALSSNPADALIQNDLGVTYYEQNKLKDAERTFRRAIALDPFALTSRYNLGLVLQRSGRRNEAREQFQVGAQGASRDDAQYFQDALRGSLRSPLPSPQP